METKGTGIRELSCQLEALVSTDDWLFLVKGGILLGTDAAVGMLAGFVTTFSSIQSLSPQQGHIFLLESRYSPTFQALGWGSLYAWCRVAVISFTSGKLWVFTMHCTRHLDTADYLIFTTLKQMKDFRS
uniref:Transmembrane protein 242 n=1 Tax=Moschus moschiferus TaxID=68415 RepID=A0A8C6DWI1_MOSMO